jgi:hypothetical protein
VADHIGDKELFVCSEALKSLESSADGLMRAGLMLRDHVMDQEFAS